MPVVTSIFLSLSLALAVVLGPQMRAWSWGPSLLALAAACACAAWVFIREKRISIEASTGILGSIAAAWFAWRAWTSPVAEFAHADLLLLAAALGGFLTFRAIAMHSLARNLFFWSLATTLLASAVLIFLQHHDPSWSQFRERPAAFPSGFFGHYNEGANFLIGAVFLLLGISLFSNVNRATAVAWILIVIAGIAAIYFTRSRGAILSAAGGTAALGIIALIMGARRKAKWFHAALIAFPILALVAAFGAFSLWQQTHEIRFGEKEDISDMMDANTRLRNYSLAVDAILRHTWTGGGSRSFTWDSLLAWDTQQHGYVHAIPEQVHNEILQAATDYGLIGAVAILAFLGWLVIRGLWLARFDSPPTPGISFINDGLRVGGLAALAGMLIQSNFSFVFHLLPGAMMLGIAIAALATPRSTTTEHAGLKVFFPFMLSACCAASMIWPAILGVRVYQVLAPVYMKWQFPPGPDDLIHRLAQGSHIWPQSELYQSRAMILYQIATRNRSSLDEEYAHLALKDYLEAFKCNPKYPGHAVNAANLFDALADPDSAEKLYHHAVNTQGGTEPAFRAHFHRGNHYHRRGVAHLRAQEYAMAIEYLTRAESDMAAAIEDSGSAGWDVYQAKARIRANLGAAREATGDIQGALQSWRAAIAQPYSEIVRYQIGDSLMRCGYTQWYSRKPEDAFIILSEAHTLLSQSLAHLPDGVTETMLREKLSTIDETLALLRTAGYGR